MTTITLPANTVWVSDDLAVAVVPGDLHPASVAGVPGYPLFVAPQEWAQYDKPCETCKGNRRVAMAGYSPAACPDCRDGRQVWELRTECPDGMRTPGAGWLPSMDYHDETCTCAGERSLLLGRFTLQVVPVVQDRTVAECVATETIVHLTSDGERLALVNCWRGGFSVVARLSLDPLPTPGRDFVLVIRKVAGA